MLDVGFNSYIDVKDATEYIEQHFMDSGEYAQNWSALTDREKEVALINATSYIEKFDMYAGRKVSESQPLSFPRKKYRVPMFGAVLVTPYVPQLYSSYIKYQDVWSNDGLSAARECCVRIALEFLTYTDKERVSTNKLRKSAIKSRSVDSVSETYETSYKDSVTRDINDDIAKAQITQYLRNWISSLSGAF